MNFGLEKVKIPPVLYGPKAIFWDFRKLNFDFGSSIFHFGSDFSPFKTSKNAIFDFVLIEFYREFPVNFGLEKVKIPPCTIGIQGDFLRFCLPSARFRSANAHSELKIDFQSFRSSFFRLFVLSKRFQRAFFRNAKMQFLSFFRLISTGIFQRILDQIIMKIRLYYKALMFPTIKSSIYRLKYLSLFNNIINDFDKIFK